METEAQRDWPTYLRTHSPHSHGVSDHSPFARPSFSLFLWLSRREPLIQTSPLTMCLWAICPPSTMKGEWGPTSSFYLLLMVHALAHVLLILWLRKGPHEVKAGGTQIISCFKSRGGKWLHLLSSQHKPPYVQVLVEVWTYGKHI